MIPRLMQNLLLPKKIDPWRMVTEHGYLKGQLALTALPRLTAVLSRADGEVVVTLCAGRDVQGVRFITGNVRTEVECVCQRCLGPLQLPLNAVVNLGLVSDEAAIDRLPVDYDPLLVPEGDSIAVARLVEDELLLALPQIPRHDNLRECVANGYLSPGNPELDQKDHQPFAVLATLLQNSPRSH